MPVDPGYGIAPAPAYPESVGSVFERGIANAAPGGRGPLRFEEGIATDTDVPDDFMLGMSQGYAAAPGRPNKNLPVWRKAPEEVYQQRAHVGSAAWIEAPTMLQDFAMGGFQDYGAPHFEEVFHTGCYYRLVNPTVVTD